MYRQFEVRKDDGSQWLMIYGSKGVDWVPVFDTDHAPGAESPRQPEGPVVPAIGGGYPQAIAAVVQSATTLIEVWESRQRRLSLEAAHEQSQSIEWLTEMMRRWGEVHSRGQGFDLRVSEYLAREASAVAGVLASNRKVRLPQSILYDLAMIQDSFRGMQQLLVGQFEALALEHGQELNKALDEQMPGRRLDLEFVRGLAAGTLPPLGKSAAKKATSDDAAVSRALENPRALRNRLFRGHELTVWQPPTEVEADEVGLLKKLNRLFEDRLPWLRPDDLEVETDRTHQFPELSLMSEFVRVRALHESWLTVSALMEASTGSQMSVLVEGPGTSVRLSGGDLQRGILESLRPRELEDRGSSLSS